MMSIAEAIRVALIVSPCATMPTAKVPTAPIPVQTAYAVPSGSVRIDMDSKPKLAIIVAMVTALGARRLISVGFLQEIRPDHFKQSGDE